MTDVIVLAVLVGLGICGVLSGLRSSGPSLETVWAAWERPVEPKDPVTGVRSVADRVGSSVVDRVERTRCSSSTRAVELRSALAVTGSDPVQFAVRLVVTVGACLLGPVALWFLVTALGGGISLGSAVLLAVVAAPVGLALSLAALSRRADERRRHFRVVIGSFVDLVVLSLAGGVGVDGALYSASQVTSDWAAQRMARALGAARDTGGAPWDALGSVGVELGIPELVELATTVQLAGTEGARIRQSLTARGESLRRHEQAEAESAANAMTERLFLPGALLLLGFLVFIGFPAVHRILGGF
jgi:hypothetical protein